MQPAQLRSRLDPDLLDQRRAGLAIGLEGLRLPTRSVEREHPLGMQVLTQRIRGDERVELADHLGVPPGREVGVDRGLRRPQPQLLEAADLGGGERLVGDVLQRVTVPERQRVARAVLLHEPFCTRGVHLVVAQVERVAAAVGDDRRAVAVQQRPQVGDVELEHLRRARRRVLAPQALDQRVGRHRAAGPQGEHREHRPLLAGAQLDGPVTEPKLDRTQKPQIHREPTLRLVDRRVNRA